MRFLRIDLSNRITDYGAELIYRKLFDASHEYSKAFFSAKSILRKLKLLSSNGDPLESERELCYMSPNNDYMQFEYWFGEHPALNITRAVIDDGENRILDVVPGNIGLNNAELLKDLECVICRFVIDRNNNKLRTASVNEFHWIPIVITDFGIKYIYQSLLDIRNEKLDYFYTGRGEADLTGATKNINAILDDVQVSKVTYTDNRFCYAYGHKAFPYQTTVLTELGLGFYINPRLYLRHTLATMDDTRYKDDQLYTNDIWTLEYDKPVAHYRIKDEDYACVFLGNYINDSEFNYVSFRIAFLINLVYKIMYDSEAIGWHEVFSVQKDTQEAFAQNNLF